MKPAGLDRDLRVVVVDGIGEPERLDAYLAAQTPHVSRTRFKALVKDGQVQVNDKTVDIPDYRVKPGDTISYIWPNPIDPTPLPENIPLDIVHEDAHLIVVNKPAGLVVHPAIGNWTGTLVNALLYHCGDSLSGIGGVRRPGIVHRLDKNTSGLLVVAKTDETHQGLARQFADHSLAGPLQRRYKALVWGRPRPSRGRIETEIGRARGSRTRMAVVTQNGKRAVTHYETVETYCFADAQAVSLIECVLETGRTHQIRVHMAHHRHPVIADPDYGAGFQTKLNRLPASLQPIVAGFGRQALHAYRLGFLHPVSNQTLVFDAAFPSDMQAFYTTLQGLQAERVGRYP